MTQTQSTAPEDRPHISVLLPVHNGADYVEGAVRSMMQQTLRQIEIIVIDDGSTDETPQILARLAAEDPRLRIARLDPNRRISGALNHGLDLARAPLLARMDADDLALPDRLMVQKRYMDAHPGVLAIGTGSRTIDAQGAFVRLSVHPRDAVMCRWITRFRPALRHPSVMFRATPLGAPADLVPLRYDSAYDYAEDHDLFARMTGLGGLVVLPEVLLDYRRHAENTTTRKRVEQLQRARAVSAAFLRHELPAELAAALEPALDAFFGTQSGPGRVAPAAIFAGLRAMLAHDVVRVPSHAAWFRGQTALLAFDMLGRSGRSRGQKLRDFAGPGRDFVRPLLHARWAARAEAKRGPAGPDVWAEDGVALAAAMGPQTAMGGGA